MAKWALALIGLVLVSGSVLATHAPHSKVLSGAEIHKTLVGKVVTDGHHWSYYLKPNGNIDAEEMGRAKQGHWAIHGNQMCLSVPTGAPDDCAEVVRGGKGLVFQMNGMALIDVIVESPDPKRSSK
ncbi:hypothetical protein OL229_20980 [Neisseriaceae bacterium JH1-16]|nr:hypothetical protein [Neisseriaceae bacterium JH1-16]